MSDKPTTTGAVKVVQGEKLRGADKVARIPVKVIPTVELPTKPSWLRVKLGSSAEVERIIAFFNKKSSKHKFETESDLVGGAAYDEHGVAVTDECVAKAKAADAVIFGAVGGPKWDKVPYAVRPEAGLLRLRKDLDLFANLRPAICYPALADAS